MWQYVIIIALILGSGIWVILPLLRPSALAAGLTGSQIDERIRQLTLDKENAYAVIKELEFDLGMGKLSKEDYESLKKQYMLEAVGYLKEIENLQSFNTSRKKRTDQDIEVQLEREILRLRKAKRDSRTAGRHCSRCGSKALDKDRFCVNCGTKL